MTRQPPHLFPFLFGLLLLTVIARPCQAGDIYVDNRIGSDVFDGLSDEAVDVRSGPVKTIRRALYLARQGDTIIIANHGVPYYEQLSLNGRHHSGFGLAKFTIIGNGAIVSGARLVPPFAWDEVAPDLWRFEPKRKGHYQLIFEGKPLPEVAVEPRGGRLPEIPAGQWAAWRGAIYYRSPKYESPVEREFIFADGDVGLSLSEVHDVAVIGLTFQHFRLDGVSAHSQCRGILLQNVNSKENGRAGLFVGGTSEVEAIDSTFTGNRKHNVLIRGENAFLRAEPELPEPPTYVD